MISSQIEILEIVMESGLTWRNRGVDPWSSDLSTALISRTTSLLIIGLVTNEEKL